MRDVITRLLRTPEREYGVLDEPLEEALACVHEDANADHLRRYATRKSTLRTILSDPRFQAWCLANEKNKVGRSFRDELVFIEAIAEEEYVLDDALGPEHSDARGGSASEPTDATTGVVSPSGSDRIAAGPVRWLLPLLTRTQARAAKRYSALSIAEALDPASGRVPDATLRRSLDGAYRELGARLAAKTAKHPQKPSKRTGTLKPRAQALLARLEAERKALACVTPRPSVLGDASVASFVPQPPSLVYRDATSGKGVEVTLPLLGAARLSVTPPGTRKVIADELRVEALDRFEEMLLDPAAPDHAPLRAYLSSEPWERALAKFQAPSQAAVVEPRSEAVAPFVVWRVDVVDGGVSLEPGVCAPNGDARYTRPLAGDDAHTARTPADERALSLLAPFRLVRSLASRGFAYTGRSPLDDEPYRKAARRALVDALCALQGGARVHSARSGRRLLVVGGELSARVTAADGGHLIQAYVGDVAVPQGALPSHLDDAGVFLWLDAANDRIFAASTSRATVAFLRAACEEDVVFPKEANAILLENARALQDVLPITVPESLVPERVRPLATPVLRLTRERADQLFVELLVRLGEAGPLAVPGKGAAHRIDGHHGRPTLLERSLAHEREIAAALSAALAIPDGVSTESLRLVGVPAMLDFLERAKATKAELLWLRDAPIVVESATWGALTLRLRSARDWFGVEGELSLEHGSVPLPAVIRAVRRGERYVALGQGRFAAITDELRERIGAVARASIEHAGGELTIPRFAAPQAAAALHGVASIDAPREWTDLLGRVRAAARREPKLPRGLRGELRSYQLEGFQWMSRLAAWGAGACLADDMGLGKTIQTLALLLDRARLGPAIVIAPTSVASNWEREARRFAPSLRVIPYRGSERGAALSGLGARDVLVMSYEIATRDVDELATLELATLVLDEAHAIKNAETQRTLAVRRLRAGFTLALTGTPIENRLAELYSLMSVLVPGLLGSQESFRTRFVLPIERDRCAESSRALAERIRPFVLRRTKAEVLRELPPRIDITRTAEPGPSERALYEAARRRALAVIANAGDDESSRFQILAELTRLRQLACHPQMLDPRSLVPSAKLEAFMALVEELRAEGHKALVFSQFTKHLDIVERALERADLRVIRLDGSTPAARRGALVDAFQSGEADLFLISLKAGGTGLNLTAANHVIHLDPWWNPAVEDQATDRAHRIGQAQTVTVIRLVSGGTIEETVLALHEQKRELAAAVLEGTATAGKLTTRELAALLDPASMGGQLAEVVPRAARQEGVSIGV